MSATASAPTNQPAAEVSATGGVSTSSSSKSVRLNGRFYWYIKILFVAAYQQLLYTLELTSSSPVGGFKLWSFLLISPIVKYFFIYDRLRKQKSPSSHSSVDSAKVKKFTLSVIGDIAIAFLVHYVALGYCSTSNARFWMYPFSQAFMILIWEYITYLVLNDNTSTYKVRLSSNPMDYMLMSLVAVNNYFSGLAIPEYGRGVHGGHVLALGFTIFAGDSLFAVMHYATHRVPSLWRLHKKHHEYKREELNTFANFYSTLPDGIFMNSGIIAAGVWMHLFGGPFAHELIQMEFLFPALYSHSKYPNQQMHYVYFYELDLIDIILGKQRTAEYHHNHHQFSDAFFSVYGTIGDDTLRRVVGPFFPKTRPRNE